MIRGDSGVGWARTGATSEAVGEVGADEGWEDGESEEVGEAGGRLAEEHRAAQHEAGPAGNGGEPPSMAEKRAERSTSGEVEGGGDGEDEVTDEGHRRELGRGAVGERWLVGSGSDRASARR
jgi:hypothetical protein